MLKTITKNRTYTLTAILFAVGFVICGLAWSRFFAVAATNPSPVRYVSFVSDQGARDPFRQQCAGPAFIEADTAWRFCEYEPGASLVAGGVWGLVRFDLDAGEAELRWPLPEDPASQVLALARRDDGALATAWGAPEPSGIYLAYPSGGVDVLGMPSAVGRIGGMAWVGEGLELVIGDAAPVAIARHEAGAWTLRETVPAPDACTGETLCAFQFAHLGEAGWRMLYAVAPVAVDAPATTPVEFILQEETGESQVVDTITLDDLDPAQYTRDADGRLTRLGDLFDQAPGNVINWTLNAAPFVLHGGAWERVAAPTLGGKTDYYFSNYAIEEGGLRWIPGLRYPQRGWQVDTWLTLRSSGDGIALARFDGARGPTLTGDTVFLRHDVTQTALLPARDGGYWVLGPNGAYMKAAASLSRADSLNVFERVIRAFENFRRLDDVNGEFYREQQVLKMAAFPLVLLSLPAGYLLVFFIGHARRNRKAWIIALAQVSAAYVMLATIFIWWFWEIMSDF